MPSIAVIGPGAIGGTLAAFLMERPENAVSICARTSFEMLKLTSKGESRSHRPKIYTEPQTQPPFDWVIIATKTYQIPQAAAWLPSLASEGTRLAVVQNGVQHLENIRPYFSTDRVVPIIIDCPVERQAPGSFIRHGDVVMHAPDSALGEEFAQLFDDPAVSVTLTREWKTAAWRKLAINCSGAICALVDQPANIAGDPIAGGVMRALIRECILVANAEGAVIEDDLADTIIAGQAAAPPGSMNSLHADFVNRRPMEWKARNGVIADLGKKHGISTPYNQLAADLLCLLEKSRT